MPEGLRPRLSLRLGRFAAWLLGGVLALPAAAAGASAISSSPATATTTSTGSVPAVQKPGQAKAPVQVLPQPPALRVPVQGVLLQDLRDTYTDQRAGGARVHEAMDILAPRGTPVLAVDSGHIAKLFLSKPGGITLYQFDPTGRFAYYYAHLDRYAEGIAEGQTVQRGQLLGYVGSTGNANPEAPHLHFALLRLDAQKRWWKGTAMNPFPYLRETDAAAGTEENLSAPTPAP